MAKKKPKWQAEIDAQTKKATTAMRKHGTSENRAVRIAFQEYNLIMALDVPASVLNEMGHVQGASKSGMAQRIVLREKFTDADVKKIFATYKPKTAKAKAKTNQKKRCE